MLWPHANRLPLVLLDNLPRQVVRLHAMLNSSPPQPSAPPMPAWGEDPTAVAVQSLRQACLERSAEYVQEYQAELDGYDSEDPEALEVRRELQRKVEYGKACKHFGPEPEATPPQLANAIVQHLEGRFAGIPKTSFDFEECTSCHAMTKLVCQLNEACLAQRLWRLTIQMLLRIVSEEESLRRQSLLRMWAHFGWPAGWKGKLRSLTEGAGPDLLKACVAIAQCCPSPDGGVASKQAGETLALCLAAAFKANLGHRTQNPTSFGYNVVDLILALHSTKTAGELEAAA
ncbi:hypothetical protein D9Q98_010534 [Chlorella vulgaris]|uniref:Uncharacterized protein n=1 Tax=Chlorella vulgaris TaxID=3077 RepID=A0A9D4YYA9_CHLVU|nr:hypothetical protein D9Q98_010534 [Chlorella vulgaris]